LKKKSGALRKGGVKKGGGETLHLERDDEKKGARDEYRKEGKIISAHLHAEERPAGSEEEKGKEEILAPGGRGGKKKKKLEDRLKTQSPINCLEREESSSTLVKKNKESREEGKKTTQIKEEKIRLE